MGPENILGPIGLMSSPEHITFEDYADQFVDGLMDELFNGSGQAADSADANAAPDLWLGPINTGPLSFDKVIDEPVTSGSDTAGSGPVGTVDSGPSQ